MISTPSQWVAIESIAGNIGCTGETLRKKVRQGERYGGVRPGPTTADQQRIKELEREVREPCALKAGLRLRRVRRADFLTIENSFWPSLHRLGLTPGVSTYRAVQICGATSGGREPFHMNENVISSVHCAPRALFSTAASRCPAAARRCARVPLQAVAYSDCNLCADG